MIYQVIQQCAQSLGNLEVCLDKAEAHAALHQYDVEVLMASRLAPDQHAFIQQVQSACDYVKFAVARLSGQIAPKDDDTEQTLAQIRARIARTVVYAHSVPASRHAGADRRRVGVSWAPGRALGGTGYLLQLTLPNTYFHITTAYDILRHNGVDVGKRDFPGAVRFSDATEDAA